MNYLFVLSYTIFTSYDDITYAISTTEGSHFSGLTKFHDISMIFSRF